MKVLLISPFLFFVPPSPTHLNSATVDSTVSVCCALLSVPSAILPTQVLSTPRLICRHSLPPDSLPPPPRSPQCTLHLRARVTFCKAPFQCFYCAWRGCHSTQGPKLSPDCSRVWKERISHVKWLFGGILCFCGFLALPQPRFWLAPSSQPRNVSSIPDSPSPPRLHLL